MNTDEVWDEFKAASMASGVASSSSSSESAGKMDQPKTKDADELLAVATQSQDIESTEQPQFISSSTDSKTSGSQAGEERHRPSSSSSTIINKETIPASNLTTTPATSPSGVGLGLDTFQSAENDGEIIFPQLPKITSSSIATSVSLAVSYPRNYRTRCLRRPTLTPESSLRVHKKQSRRGRHASKPRQTTPPKGYSRIDDIVAPPNAAGSEEGGDSDSILQDHHSRSPSDTSTSDCDPSYDTSIPPRPAMPGLSLPAEEESVYERRCRRIIDKLIRQQQSSSTRKQTRSKCSSSSCDDRESLAKFKNTDEVLGDVHAEQEDVMLFPQLEPALSMRFTSMLRSTDTTTTPPLTSRKRKLSATGVRGLERPKKRQKSCVDSNDSYKEYTDWKEERNDEEYEMQAPSRKRKLSASTADYDGRERKRQKKHKTSAVYSNESSTLRSSRRWSRDSRDDWKPTMSSPYSRTPPHQKNCGPFCLDCDDRFDEDEARARERNYSTGYDSVPQYDNRYAGYDSDTQYNNGYGGYDDTSEYSEGEPTRGHPYGYRNNNDRYRNGTSTQEEERSRRHPYGDDGYGSRPRGYPYGGDGSSRSRRYSFEDERPLPQQPYHRNDDDGYSNRSYPFRYEEPPLQQLPQSPQLRRQQRYENDHDGDGIRVYSSSKHEQQQSPPQRSPYTPQPPQSKRQQDYGDDNDGIRIYPAKDEEPVQKSRQAPPSQRQQYYRDDGDGIRVYSSSKSEQQPPPAQPSQPQQQHAPRTVRIKMVVDGSLHDVEPDSADAVIATGLGILVGDEEEEDKQGGDNKPTPPPSVAPKTHHAAERRASFTRHEEDATSQQPQNDYYSYKKKEEARLKGYEEVKEPQKENEVVEENEELKAAKEQYGEDLIEMVDPDGTVWYAHKSMFGSETVQGARAARSNAPPGTRQMDAAAHENEIQAAIHVGLKEYDRRALALEEKRKKELEEEKRNK